jgi:trans-aconitate methyltransferase
VAAGPVLEVECGPAAATAAMAARFGVAAVAAVELSERFVAACKPPVPGENVRVASRDGVAARAEQREREHDRAHGRNLPRPRWSTMPA